MKGLKGSEGEKKLTQQSVRKNQIPNSQKPHVGHGSNPVTSHPFAPYNISSYKYVKMLAAQPFEETLLVE